MAIQWLLKVPRGYDVLGGASENTRRQYQVEQELLIRSSNLEQCQADYNRVGERRRR